MLHLMFMSRKSSPRVFVSDILTVSPLVSSSGATGAGRLACGSSTLLLGGTALLLLQDEIQPDHCQGGGERLPLGLLQEER